MAKFADRFFASTKIIAEGHDGYTMQQTPCRARAQSERPSDIADYLMKIRAEGWSVAVHVRTKYGIEKE